MTDIDDPNQSIKELRELVKLIDNGFMALSFDYSFYVKSTLSAEEGKHKIYEMRNDVLYRFKSSIFQYYILLRHRIDTSAKYENMLAKDPKIFDGFLSGNPYFKHSADEIMSIYDGIIFHLSSLFDYLSMMVNFTFGKSPTTPMMWGQLVKSCRDKNNYYKKYSFVGKVDEVDRKFVSKFNDYRADLIHRKSSSSYANVSWTPSSGRVNVKFECSDNITKYFKNILDLEQKYSLAYLTNKLILECSINVAKVLDSMRSEFDNNWIMNKEIRMGNVAGFGFIHPETGFLTSPSYPYWIDFDKQYKTLLNQ